MPKVSRIPRAGQQQQVLGKQTYKPLFVESAVGCIRVDERVRQAAEMRGAEQRSEGSLGP